MNKKIDFGDYCIIKQKRCDCEDEEYLHKVIGKLNSNRYVDVPVQVPAREVTHDKIEEVVACVCCGADEREILRYRVVDVYTYSWEPNFNVFNYKTMSFKSKKSL